MVGQPAGRRLRTGRNALGLESLLADRDRGVDERRVDAWNRVGIEADEEDVSVGRHAVCLPQISGGADMSEKRQARLPIGGLACSSGRNAPEAHLGPPG